MAIPMIYKTSTMLAAVELLPPQHTFLRDRYFPFNRESDLFPTEEVLVEYREGNKKMAPAVLPRKGGITIEREGYKTNRYVPPYIAPQRPLTIDDLNRKGFGENLFSDRTPQQREAEILGQDLLEFDNMISAREEYIAAQAMLNNGYVLKHYADKYGAGEYEEWVIRFYEGQSNPGAYTPDADWDAEGGDIFGDLGAMIRLLTSKGLPATDLIVAPDVADVLLNNEKVKDFLNNRRMNLGNIDPKMLPAGAASLGTINVQGRNIEIFTYDETYEDETTGENTPYIPAGTVILTAPASGRSLYGAVTQLEQSDDRFHTYMGRRVPKYLAKSDRDIREIKVTSRPLLIPRAATPWISAKVLTV